MGSLEEGGAVETKYYELTHPPLLCATWRMKEIEESRMKELSLSWEEGEMGGGIFSFISHYPNLVINCQ